VLEESALLITTKNVTKKEIPESDETKQQRKINDAKMHALPTLSLLGLTSESGCLVAKPEERGMTLAQLELVW
jgi:hypothetical protein